MFNLDKSSNDTSAALDVMRAGAAQMVCVGHAVIFFVAQWAPQRLPWMQNVGVLVFFLISGFLITATLVQRSAQSADYGFGRFAIERFARIYTGLVPALAAVVLIDALVSALTGWDRSYAPYPDVKTLLANLAMLEGYRGAFDNHDALQWGVYGSAAPLWTLAIEWHIYLFVGAVFFIGARQHWVPLLIVIAVVFGQTPLHYLAGDFMGDGVGRGLFALWLAGSAVYFAARRLGRGFAVAWLAAAIAAIAFAATTRARAEYVFSGYSWLTIAFLCVIVGSQGTSLITSARALRIIRFFADYSFSLYLIHYTVLFALRKLWPEAGIPGLLTGLLLANVAAIGLAEIGEKHHRKLARWLMRATAATAPAAD